MSPESNLGGEVHDREMLKALADQGVEIHIILPLFKKHEAHANFHFYFLPIPFVYPPLLFNLLILPYLVFIYLKVKFSILRVSSPYFVGPAAMLFKRFFPSVKVIATYHHLDDSSINNFIDKLVIGGFDKVVTVSNFTKTAVWEKYKTYIKREEKLSVIYNGVNSKYRPSKKKDQLVNELCLGNKVILLYLGQLVSRKNIFFLLDVLKKLPLEFSLVIAGKGNLEESLKTSVLHHNLTERVIFTGKISEDRKMDLYGAADLFVYPSLKEGFGMALVEALRCGKLTIASDLSVFKEIIKNGVNGFLLPLDSKVWADLIISLSKNPANMAKIEKRGFKSSLAYKWELSAANYLNLLRDKTSSES